MRKTKRMLRKIQMVNKWKKCITSLKRHFHSSNEQRSETDYSTLARARETPSYKAGCPITFGEST